MASSEYHPDPYEGWRVVHPNASNVTAHTILTDTSGRWRRVLDLGFYRVYQSTS